jgi:hypothetical protein
MSQHFVVGALFGWCSAFLIAGFAEWQVEKWCAAKHATPCQWQAVPMEATND